MRIVDAKLGDAPILADLHRAIFPDGPWATPFWRNALQVNEGPILISMGPTSPLGLCAARIAVDEAELLSIGVLAGARGGGVAGELLEALYRRLCALGVSQLFLEVSEANEPARRLYARHQFSEAGRRPHYYGPGDDALVLSRTL
ncbi:MAG: GNAT family N-acetyltransferase [Pseudomonadota bacterium]